MKRYQVRIKTRIIEATDDRREAVQVCDSTPGSHVWSYAGAFIIHRHGDRPMEPLRVERGRML